MESAILPQIYSHFQYNAVIHNTSFEMEIFGNNYLVEMTLWWKAFTGHDLVSVVGGEFIF